MNRALPAVRRSLWSRLKWLPVIVVVGAAGLYGGVIGVLGPKVAAIRAARQQVVQTVVASGLVQTPKRVEIGSQITGTVRAVPVEEGQTVKRGVVLVVIEDTEFRAAFDQAKAAIAQAEAKLKQISDVLLPSAEEQLAQAEANLLNARQTFERIDKLRANGFASNSQYDDAKKTLDVALTQQRMARLQVATNRPDGSDYLLAVTQLEQAKANLRTAQSKLDYTTIEAPVDGTLITRNVEAGTVVQPGRILMLLSPSGDTQLVVQIDEKNLRYLALGQSALASADAYPNDRFAAKLVYINPGVDSQRGSVEVKLDVVDPPSYLRQDMTISVDIEVGRKADAIAIPLSLVRDAASDHPTVLKLVNGHVTRQAVTLGLRGGGLVEVASGLAEGDVVVAQGTARIGARVRPVLS